MTPREMARAFIDDNSRPYLREDREARFAMIKGLLANEYLYNPSTKLIKLSRYNRRFLMPKIELLPDIKVPFKRKGQNFAEGARDTDKIGITRGVQYISGGRDDGGKKAALVPPMPAPEQPHRIDF